MPYLLRKFSNKDAWAEVENSPLWEQGDCPPEALVQVFDNRAGVSTWRVSTEEEVERVIAAQAFMRGTIGDFAYCLIDEDVLRKDGIKLKNTPVKTMDKHVNELHVDIVELSAQQLVRLARRINNTGLRKFLDTSEPFTTRRRFESAAPTERANPQPRRRRRASGSGRDPRQTGSRPSRRHP
jgi:hypothetical protein